ncbi:f-box domain-containing protein [Stemphylium lycopersici]|nr:f-box domain-containing protein [Stemphylium lycopersici]
MSYHQGQPQLGATFVPGGFDDYYMPAPSPEVISPAPQRIMPEVPENMQENIAQLELEANGPRGTNGAMSPMQGGYNQSQQNFSPQQPSYGNELPAHNDQWLARQASISSAFRQPPNVQPQPVQQQQPSHDYNQFAQSNDAPNFSPFPKLPNRPPNVPPSDDEKEAVLENARLPVLNSNDPEMQLAWAQDALQYVDAAQLHEQRISEIQGARPATPQVEHQLRLDAMNVVSFLADQHHPKATFMRGMWLEFGKFGMRADKKEAFRCYSRAAAKGYSRAEYRMGMQFEQSNDPIKALQNYKAGAEQGDSASNYRLGMMTLLGQHGQPQDFARGVQLIRLAAATADENAPQGAYVLGMLQARELPQINVPETFLPYDERGARQNIEKAAYLGFAKAQLKMGSAYELCSLGCEFNPTLSLHYNALASRQGEPEADMAISKWFLCGHEGEFNKNEELAYQYAQRAAAAGLATAEFAMGYFHEIGMNVQVNLDKALEWYDKAEKNGNKDATARIESISKLSRTLSKKDHENVAINMIKSKHGSMRGQRPARLQKGHAPLPSISDVSPSDYGADSPATPGGGRLPGRGDSTTPYPMSDQPPTVSNQPMSPPYDRPSTAAPYPMDNGPPRLGPQRPTMAGGFAPEVRASSARPTSSAFNINPNVFPPNDPYGRGSPRPGPDMGPIPMRPHTSVDNMGPGRGGRTSSMGRGTPLPPGGPGSYRQPGGPSAQRPEMHNRPSSTQPPDVGYNAPDGRHKLQKQTGAPLMKAPTLPDIGYVAPLEPRQHTRPSTVQPGQESRTSSRIDRPGSATPGQGSHPSSRPGSAGRPSGYDNMPKPNRVQTLQQQPQQQQQPPPPKPAPAQSNKPTTPTPPSKPASSSASPAPGKGPKTFDEMGIGQAPKDSDCGASVVPDRFSGEGARSELPHPQRSTGPWACPPPSPPPTFLCATPAITPMAAVMSAKRPRAPTVGIDSSGIGHGSRNKRPRQSEPDGSDESSDDDVSDAASSDDSSDQEAEQTRNAQEAWATQQVQKERQETANRQNIATDSGIIEEIQCINFMCHEHLTVTLGPLINFIIGHNGSGKSAVLTALTICLGGKATATNRAQNLKSLIKEGKDHASVTVKIKNQGPLAYKPAQYGGSIIVERHFSRSGTSGFKLKDQNNKLVTNKKAELEDILDAFSMQIDNPMNVLTQDMARQFLNHSTPKDKYRFFLQGTQLENLNRDYQQIEQSLEVMNARAEVKETDLAVLRRQMVDLENKARRAQMLEQMRAKEAVIAKQAAWATVEEQEKEVADSDKGVADTQAAILERQRKVDEADQRYEQADQAHEAAKQRVTDIINEMEPANQLADEAKVKFDEVKAKLKQLQSDERQARSEMAAKKSEVARYEAQIEQHQQRQTQADNGLYAEKIRERDEAKTQCDIAREAYENHDKGLLPLQDQLKAVQKEQMTADAKVKKARDDERRIRNVISSLRGGQRDWVDCYQNPAKLKALLNAINLERRFREPPVGPMGRHVKLLNSKWARILEKQFGQMLNSFVVTTKQDQTILNPINTANNEPARELLTWMRVLTIDDDLVRNQLIINQSIEQTVLIENMEEGIRFMNPHGSLVKNVRMCFTFADGDTRKGRVINFTGNGGTNNSPIGEFLGNLRMQVDRDAQVREEEARLAQAEREVQSLTEAFGQLQTQVNAGQSRVRDHERQKKALKIALQHASDNLDRLEGELSEVTPDAAAIEVAEEALETAKKEFGRLDGFFEDLQLRKFELNAENRDNKREMEEAQKFVEDLRFKLDKAQSMVRKYQSTREDELKAKNDAIAKVATAQGILDEWLKQAESNRQELERVMEGAQAVCEERVPVPAGRDSNALAHMLAKLQATREATEKELGGSQDELLRAANEAKRMHKDAMEDFESIKDLRNQLITTLTNRRNRWKQFRSGISVRARVTFNYLLSERKFRGTLSIDHQKALLDIHVQPDIMERSGDGRQTKTLSGGEKSYSTVCLLLSLWDAMGSPIRCLDELFSDVFMDSVNRERSMHMIIQAARRSIGRQFIFITPQSMSNVNQTSDVKIIKMTDPERGQTALNLSRGTASPLPSDGDFARSLSPSHDDAQLSGGAQGQSEDVWAATPAPGTVKATASASAEQVTIAKGKEKAAKSPLKLLDLPMDILKEIIHQLPHTNDLTSLCLCHSALHRLTIPCIYSRFDIVWPDESTHNEPRAGVDALTYGLATLVMGDDCFPHQSRLRLQGQTPTALPRTAANPYPVPQRRFGNYYGQFTKKFSLGNGPQAWVQEYMITKEGGKMLGTLVALAIARMVNLETFVWDMPTGVLRDVWLALSSLAHRSDGEECRLDRLWIRWHDNTIDAPVPPPAPPMILNNQNLPPPPNTTHPSGLGTVQAPIAVVPPYAPSSMSALDRVEHPTFSAIPALKSLSVLDIDELPYLDEMSILIARSQKKLRELRIGIAAHAQQRDWVTVWEGEGLQQVDYNATTTAACSIGEKRLGGVLGILVGRIHNMRHSEEPPSQKPGATGATERSVEATPIKSAASLPLPSIASLSLHEREADQDVDHFGNPMDETSMTEGISLFNDNQPVSAEQISQPAHPEKSTSKSRTSSSPNGHTSRERDSSQEPAEPLLTGKLKLEVLELERVPLSVPVLRRAFDWSILSTLTLLHCSNHEQLWKILRRTYTPRSAYPGSPSSSKAYKASYTLRSEYQLNLKRIHTNTVSPSLISFLKETLAPNSLEVLFLQEGRSYSSTVTVDAIYKGPMKRHRASLKKLMIDSGEKGPDGHTTTSSRWRRWMLNREILTFITSGRMNSLRELAVSIDYKDWHHFLQRLPYIPHIRSLYIPFIADHAHGSNIDPRELAYQILDIVHLRPEIELCYMGLSTKCFEILENRPSNYDLRHDGMHADGSGSAYATHDPMLSDDESEATEDDDDDSMDEGAAPTGGDETESDVSDEAEAESDDESFIQDSQKGPKLRYPRCHGWVKRAATREYALYLARASGAIATLAKAAGLRSTSAMDHSTLVFASVFPILSFSHSTPTPVATPDLGSTAPGNSFGSPYALRNTDARGQGQRQHRAVRRNIAWSCATRFLSLPKDVSIAPRVERNREVEEALNYLLVGEGKSDDGNEESLVDWYTNECRLHFANHVRPGLEELWRNEVELRQAWDILDETQRLLEQVQDAYLQPFSEHLLPAIQQNASSTTLRPNRPTQLVNSDAATAVDWKFRRDIQAVFAYCLPLQRYSKTLSYVLYDAACRLFRIYNRHDGMQTLSTPQDSQEFRKRMAVLLQGLERVGLGGDSAQKAFAHAMTKLLDSFITSHYLKVDWYSKKTVVPQLRLWIQDGFCPLVELVLECLRCEHSSILPSEVSSWQEMALARLGRARVDNLFDFVIHWDKSLGAILDIKEYLKVANAKQHLTSSFSQQISRRLLHPGATTTYILNVYISIIRSFHELEPKGVLLERVARPIRRYLKERENTARIIILSLLTDLSDETGSKFSSNSELSYEIASEMAKPFANYGQDADEELNWNDMNWQPLPQDASPDYKKSKVEDVIWFLLTLWEREDFINELKNIYGDHLLRCQDPGYEKEIRLLELIKVRLGDDKLQACEVMLRDVLESRRINGTIRTTTSVPIANSLVTPDHRSREPQTPDGRHPRTPQPRRPARSKQNATPSGPATASSTGPTLNAQILSSFFWPQLRDDTFRVPAQIDALQKEYESRFERIKGMRKLRWMNGLGTSSITLTFDDRTEEFDQLTPWQVSVIYAFQPQPNEESTTTTKGGEGLTRNVPQLEEMLEMDESLINQALSFWVGKSVLRFHAPSTYSIIESLPKASSKTGAHDADAAAAAEELASIQANATNNTIKSQSEMLEEKKDVYTAFIMGMLTNQGNMNAGRIAMMMRMMVQGGFPFGVEEVGGLLEELEAGGKVVRMGGDVWGVRK